jgi:hypothetical protein
MLRRRGLLGGLLGALALPAIVRPGLLMPVRPVLLRFDPSAAELLEEYARTANDWMGSWRGEPGNMETFVEGLEVGSVSGAMLRLARMRELEARLIGRAPPADNWAEHWRALRGQGLA